MVFKICSKSLFHPCILGKNERKLTHIVLGHLLVRSHRKLICSLCTAHFARALRFAHLFARSLTHSLPSWWESGSCLWDERFDFMLFQPTVRWSDVLKMVWSFKIFSLSLFHRWSEVLGVVWSFKICSKMFFPQWSSVVFCGPKWSDVLKMVERFKICFHGLFLRWSDVLKMVGCLPQEHFSIMQLG